MAGEVGHIRLSTNGPVGYGKSGAFEGFCSGGGIAQLGKTRILEKFQQGKTVTFCKNINMLDKITAKDIAEAAYSGDNFAKEIYRECGQYLGMGLSMLIDILNPQAIIIGGIFSRCQDLLIEETNKIIEKEALVLSSKVCRVVPAKLGEEIGDYAAIAVAMD